MKEYIGKRVLIGLTYIDENKKVESRDQFLGVIQRITKKGIFLELANGEEYVLPPELRSLEPAEPGRYYCKDSTAVVIDPDFVTAWRVGKRNPDNPDEDLEEFG